MRQWIDLGAERCILALLVRIFLLKVRSGHSNEGLTQIGLVRGQTWERDNVSYSGLLLTIGIAPAVRYKQAPRDFEEGWAVSLLSAVTYFRHIP